MNDNLLNNKSSIGLWSDYVAIDPKKLATINLSPIQITEDQLIQLYLMLYPMIVADFTSRADNFKWEQNMHKEMDDKLSIHSKALNTHVHTGNMGAPTSPITSIPGQDLTIESWTTHPEDRDYKEAEGYVTSSSKYSSSIEHRDPSKDSADISRVNVVDINSQYSSKLIYVPFDVDPNTDETGDSKFAGNS